MGAPRLTTEAELRAALAQRRTVLYLTVDWGSIQEQVSRETFASFVDRIERDHPDLGVAFCVLGEDCAGGVEWFRESGLSGAAGGGYGAVIWLDGGVVREVVVYAAAVGVERLVERTLTLWDPCHRPVDVPPDR